MNKTRRLFVNTLIYLAILAGFILVYEGMYALSRLYYRNGIGADVLMAELFAGIVMLSPFLFHVGYGIFAYFSSRNTAKKSVLYPMVLQAVCMYIYLIVERYINIYDYHIANLDKFGDTSVLMHAINQINPLKVPYYFLLAYITVNLMRAVSIMRKLKETEKGLDLPPATTGQKLALIGICLGGIILYALLFALNLAAFAFLFTIIYYLAFAKFYAKAALKICGRLYESTVMFFIGGVLAIVLMLIFGYIVASNADLAGAAVFLMFIGIAIVIMVGIAVSIITANKYLKSLEANEQDLSENQSDKMPKHDKKQITSYILPAVLFDSLLLIMSIIERNALPLIAIYCYDFVLTIYYVAHYLIIAAASAFYGIYAYRKYGKIIKPCLILLAAIFLYQLCFEWGHVFPFNFYSSSVLISSFVAVLKVTFINLGYTAVAAACAYIYKLKSDKDSEDTQINIDGQV